MPESQVASIALSAILLKIRREDLTPTVHIMLILDVIRDLLVLCYFVGHTTLPGSCHCRAFVPANLTYF